MKQEDADWLVYHQIPPSEPIPVADLAIRCGLESPVVEDSVARLERYCLIERTGVSVRMLTFGEALVRNQCQHDKSLPFVIENGVIKERRK